MGKNVTAGSRKIKKRTQARTLLLVGKHGDIKQVKWVKPLIYLALLILIASTGTTGFFYYKFTDAMKDVELIKKALLESEERAQKFEQEKITFMARMVMAESKMGKNSGVGGNDGKQSKKQAVEAVQAKPADNTYNGELNGDVTDNGAVIAKKPEIQNGGQIQPGPPPKVSAEDFVVTRFKKTVSVGFNIKNIDSASNRISGHIVVVLKTRNGGPADWVTMPGNIELVGGKPTGKHVGKTFSISRFKSVDFKTRKITKPGRYKIATVFIFTRDGEPMLEKNFPITIK